MRRATILAAWSASVVSLLAGGASASPNARLVYGRSLEADGCPDEARLRAAVASRVGYDPFFPHAPRTVVVTIARKDRALVARIELIDDSAHSGGARELTATPGACEELFQSTALAIAIDPRALLGPASTPAEERDAPHAPEPPPPPPLADRAEPAERRPPPALPASGRPRIRVTAAGRGSAGIAPALAPGFFAGGGLVWRRTSLGVELGAHLSTVAGSRSGAEARAWIAAGAVVPCIRVVPLDLCGTLAVGRFEATGQRVVAPSTEATPFVGVGLRPGLEVPLGGGVQARVDVDVLANLTRTTVRVGDEALWRAWPVALAASAGASYDFP
jgi:hypothetical protein